MPSWAVAPTAPSSADTIAIGRTRDKWPTEDTLALIDGTLADAAPRSLTATDFAWEALALAGLALAVGMR